MSMLFYNIQGFGYHDDQQPKSLYASWIMTGVLPDQFFWIADRRRAAREPMSSTDDGHSTTTIIVTPSSGPVEYDLEGKTPGLCVL
ncbi:hypothetical protein PSTT_15549 [Puccinia striiformis]|uniref:Uncharacterized protein n=1 Tax=Puccinia striiformis TaxID=27350 RepID=A0A2S4UH26_9BASI|nr:hypothetical protein PSTT_15549 [Puccinia striiformis]